MNIWYGETVPVWEISQDGSKATRRTVVSTETTEAGTVINTVEEETITIEEYTFMKEKETEEYQKILTLAIIEMYNANPLKELPVEQPKAKTLRVTTDVILGTTYDNISRVFSHAYKCGYIIFDDIPDEFKDDVNE